METTLAIIKPDSYRDGNAGKIIDRIISEGFTIKEMKQIHMNKEKAEGCDCTNDCSEHKGVDWKPCSLCKRIPNPVFFCR